MATGNLLMAAGVVIVIGLPCQVFADVNRATSSLDFLRRITRTAGVASVVGWLGVFFAWPSNLIVPIQGGPVVMLPSASELLWVLGAAAAFWFAVSYRAAVHWR
jgi:hypothetical protein